EHLDQYSAPRLVEYWDENPCDARDRTGLMFEISTKAGVVMRAPVSASHADGVHIEARYTVGEYDILVLSATNSAGLEAWLEDNGYRIPDGAGSILSTYLKQNMRFFVAKVNLKEQA